MRKITTFLGLLALSMLAACGQPTPSAERQQQEATNQLPGTAANGRNALLTDHRSA